MASASDADPADVLADLGEPRPLERSDVPEATRAIARAFAWHEPWGAWAMPDADGREERLHRLIEADVIERFIPHGECWTIGCASTTLWIPPVRPGTATEVFGRRRGEAEYAAFGELGDAMRAGDALIASLRPAEEHWYLDTIATEPRALRPGPRGPPAQPRPSGSRRRRRPLRARHPHAAADRLLRAPRVRGDGTGTAQRRAGGRRDGPSGAGWTAE